MTDSCRRHHRNHGCCWTKNVVFLTLLLLSTSTRIVHGFGLTGRFFVKPPQSHQAPQLILIGGCPGTGKSTFGMSVALDQGILKCISTDTVRAVMRSFVDENVSPALHRSSYAESFEGDDPVRSWKETCNVLQASVESLIDDAIARRTSIVVEGVHIIPSKKLIDKWEQAGGVAIGCILQIANEEQHKQQLRKRGYLTGVVEAEEKKIESFHRIRAIQGEMMNLAQQSNWLQIEQRTEADPLDMVAYALNHYPSPYDEVSTSPYDTDDEDTHTKNIHVSEVTTTNGIHEPQTSTNMIQHDELMNGAPGL